MADQQNPRDRDDHLVITDDDGQTRRRYTIGARKIPKRLRDVARRVLSNPAARYGNILRADDEDNARDGEDTAYVAWLTDAEAEQFRAASNARYVELDGEVFPNDYVIPPVVTLDWMDASLAQQGDFNGDDVIVAVLDGGTTQAVRDQCPWTRIARRVFSPTDPGAGEIVGSHGCLVTPEAVPPGGKLVEAMIVNNSAGSGTSTWADSAAAMIWAADQGAKVINYSFSAPPGFPSSVIQDAIRYLYDRGVQLIAAAGNDAQNRINYPADQSRIWPNVHSAGAFNETTDSRAGFSNYDFDMSGVMSGENCLSLNPQGALVRWNGTSSAAPKMALLIAMGTTGDQYSAQQMANALRASARDTGQSRDQQGSGAWNLDNALALLADDAAPHPEESMRAYATARQLIGNAQDIKVKFPSTEYTTTDIEINSAKDTFTVKRAGQYLITATGRYDAFQGTGERYFGLGNDLTPAQAGAQRWAGDGDTVSGGVVSASLVTEKRFATGDKIAMWAFQNCGNALDLLPTVGQASRTVSITISRIGD